jgi:hypothetical protein
MTDVLAHIQTAREEPAAGTGAGAVARTAPSAAFGVNALTRADAAVIDRPASRQSTGLSLSLAVAPLHFLVVDDGE